MNRSVTENRLFALDEFGLLDWNAHDELYEAGYRYAVEMLSQWKFEPQS